MNQKKELKATYDIKTTLGTQTVFNGTMKFKESLKILGRCEGKIQSQGFLFVEKGAEVIAEIKVGSLVVGGTIKGDVEALGEVEMLSTGKIYGNIKAAKLKVADGVVFEGKVEMLKNSEAIDIFSATPSQLKQSLETV